MSKASDIAVGFIIGGAILGSLGYLMAPIPIIGWIIAAAIAGYYAGRLGDWWSGFILALVSPKISIYETTTFLSAAPMVMSSNSALGSLYGQVVSLFGSSVVVYVVLSNLINVTSIGFSASIGSLGYARSRSKVRASSKAGLVVTSPPMAQPATQPAPSGGVPPAPPAVPSASPAPATPAPSATGAQQSRSSIVKLVQTYNKVRADPKDKPFRNQVYVSLISNMVREAEELTKNLLSSQPDGQRATSAGLLKDSLIDEFKRRYPNLEPPNIVDPVGQSLLDSVREAIRRGILSGSVDSYGASTPDEVDGLATLIASDILMASLERFLSKIGS